MAINNPANDRYNPPSNRSEDFEETYFVDIEDGELFWRYTGTGDIPRGSDNSPWRKVNGNTADNLRGRVSEKFLPRDKVYVRT
tara:strand:- start:750 stop:998 length:249 start_codon:yes stop_codon:yes gene_type:complete